MSRARAVEGAAAGVVATAAMSIVMVGAERVGLVSRPAPEVLTSGLLDAAGADRTEGGQRLLAGVGHFGYGGVAGAAFAALSPRLRWSPRWTGPVYGLLLCLAGYQGWVPAAALMPPLHRQHPARRSTLIGAHLVYGTVLGALVGRTHAREQHEAGDGR